MKNITLTFISLPDLSFPLSISSRKLSTILIVILGPKSDTNKACKIRLKGNNLTNFRSVLTALRHFFLIAFKQGIDKRNLFEFVEDAIGIGEIPVQQEFVDDGEVISRFRKPREDLFNVTLGLFLD